MKKIHLHSMNCELSEQVGMKIFQLNEIAKGSEEGTTANHSEGGEIFR